MVVDKDKEASSTSVNWDNKRKTSDTATEEEHKDNMNAIVIIHKGKVALGKLAQAIMYRAEIVEIDGNFDDALKMVKKISENNPVTLVNSTNPYRLEGQKTAAFEIIDQLGGVAPDILAIPVGNAGNISAY